MPNDPIYLDHSATTPLAPEVREAMLPWLGEHFGNPGSLHRQGREAREAIENARVQVASLIGADPAALVFTGSGTEASNLAILGAGSGGRIAVGATEHHAVLEPARMLEVNGRARVHVLPVNADGVVETEVLQDTVAAGVRLLSIMAVNNETGVMADTAAIGALCRERGALYHTDAVQALSCCELNVEQLSVDLLTLSAHKINGPKGIGACYVRPGVKLDPLVTGGGQEGGLRAGTENVAAIVGFGRACERLREARTERAAHVLQLRTQMEAQLLARIDGCWINGAAAPRAPHITSLGLKGMDGEMLLYALDAAGIAVSRGAACASGSPAPSHVLLAMGQDYPTAQAAIRISLSWMNTTAEVERFVSQLVDIVIRLRA
ncbi:MAG: cysteine desulfurase [Candidatus Hydrogenedentes bacterium]|nr:cysteine desulfurase [Candidatus Hydrogenedentota bacterium]